MLLTLFRNSASEHLKGLSQSESRLTSIRNALSKRQEQEGRWTQKKYVSPKITSIPKGLDRLAYALSEFLAVRPHWQLKRIAQLTDTLFTALATQ